MELGQRDRNGMPTCRKRAEAGRRKADRRHESEKFNKINSERRAVQSPYGIASGEDGER